MTICAQDALWVALGKLGVPEKTIQLIRSFHQDMKARIRLDRMMVVEEIEVQNGLRFALGVVLEGGGEM